MVPGNFRLTAGDLKFPIPFEPGTVAQVSFTLDNSLADAPVNVQATPPQSLRIAIMDQSGAVQHRETVTVGRKTTDNGTKPSYININTPKTACAVFVSPGPDGPSDQRIAFCLHDHVVYTHPQG